VAEYLVWTLVDEVPKPNPWNSEISESQLRKRIRDGWNNLQARLAKISLPFTILKDCPESAMIFIKVAGDATGELTKVGLCFTAFGKERIYTPDMLHPFYIRAAVGTKPDTQDKITRLIQEVFGGTPGVEPYTFFVPCGDPETRWLPDKRNRRTVVHSQMKRLAETLISHDLAAEIGLMYETDIFSF